MPTVNPPKASSSAARAREGTVAAAMAAAPARNASRRERTRSNTSELLLGQAELIVRGEAKKPIVPRPAPMEIIRFRLAVPSRREHRPDACPRGRFAWKCECARRVRPLDLAQRLRPGAFRRPI